MTTMEKQLEEIYDMLMDNLLLERCKNFTRKMLEMNVDINKITNWVKDYIRKYLYLKKNHYGNHKTFTFEMWFNCITTPSERPKRRKIIFKKKI